MTSPITTNFEVNVSKETFKFNAAHFVAFKGYRERLHGHNYKVGVRMLGSKRIGADGYLIDFGHVKDVTKKICKDLNEHFICPTLSDVLQIQVDNDKKSVAITCEDGSLFMFPYQDCAMIPIVHATSEELAMYLWNKLLQSLPSEFLRARGIHTLEVTVQEAPGQDATFRLEIPINNSGNGLDIASFITKGEVIPMPCPSEIRNKEKNKQQKETNKGCNDDCSACLEAFSEKLQKIANAINDGNLVPSNDKKLTAQDLEQAIAK